MKHDPSEEEFDEGADGWLVPDASPSVLVSTSNQPFTPEEIEAGKTLAILGHGSLLLGFPLFLLPIFMRDNRYALHHAKAAGVTYALFMISATLTAVTCGLLFPLIFLCYVPALIALVRAANGELAGKWGMGDVAERMLSGLEVPPEKIPRNGTKSLETHDQ